MKKVFWVILVLVLSSCEIPLEVEIKFDVPDSADGGLDLACDLICPDIEETCEYAGCWDICDRDPLFVGACYFQYITCGTVIPCIEGRTVPDGGL